MDPLRIVFLKFLAKYLAISMLTSLFLFFLLHMLFCVFIATPFHACCSKHSVSVVPSVTHSLSKGGPGMINIIGKF